MIHSVGSEAPRDLSRRHAPHLRTGVPLPDISHLETPSTVLLASPVNHIAPLRNTQLRRLPQVYDTVDIIQLDYKRREGDCELIVRVRMQSHTHGRLGKGMYNMDIVHPIGTIGGCSAGRYYLTDSSLMKRTYR